MNVIGYMEPWSRQAIIVWVKLCLTWCQSGCTWIRAPSCFSLTLTGTGKVSLWLMHNRIQRMWCDADVHVAACVFVFLMLTNICGTCTDCDTTTKVNQATLSFMATQVGFHSIGSSPSHSPVVDCNCLLHAITMGPLQFSPNLRRRILGCYSSNVYLMTFFLIGKCLTREKAHSNNWPRVFWIM